jgi:predicted cupin superfamily sugar epimerase
LLRRNEISRWHRLKSSEVWTWHAGGSLLMTLGGSGTLPLAAETRALGSRLDQGEQFNLLVPPDQWQTTRVISGDFVLVSCVVAPAYEDADCLLPEKPLPNEIYPEECGADYEN